MYFHGCVQCCHSKKSKTLDGPLKKPQKTPSQICRFCEKILLFLEKIELFRKKVAFLAKISDDLFLVINL